MGSPKMLLPWGEQTILEHIVSVFAKAGIDDIVVVTGGARESVEAIIRGCQTKYPVQSVFNEDYMVGDMLSSMQCGLRYLSEKGNGAALIGLGDQPQIQERSVRLLCEAYSQTQSPLVVPSFHMRRGHPWIVARELWGEIIAMQSSQTPRDFLNVHAKDIQYVEMDTPTILADLDTPEEYLKFKP